MSTVETELDELLCEPISILRDEQDALCQTAESRMPPSSDPTAITGQGIAYWMTEAERHRLSLLGLAITKLERAEARERVKAKHVRVIDISAQPVSIRVRNGHEPEESRNDG